MNDSSERKLRDNIRALRLAYGETQEQLGVAINVEKNTISNYETGKRDLDKDTITAIAQHYMVSVGELLHSDLTHLGKITVQKDAFWKNIDLILPMVSSPRAMQNEHFKKAYMAHKEFYSQLHRVSLDCIDIVGVCEDEYMEAAEDETIEAEASANFIALWYLQLMMIKNTPSILKNRPAALLQIAEKDSKARQIIENADPALEKEAQDFLDELYDDETKEFISDLLTTIKRSPKWSDLADYYLALQYVWNLVDNDLGWGFNHRIGAEMMNAFVSVNNLFAARFLKYGENFIAGSSSQSVDDN